ncbi:unnamed protein product [Moneuplotes crassus]|uniref:Uncharacterized protein n=1 Tax=Euplotes crassus TaxID=5936 RepID=A0AAD1XIL0_EUPCR|nr:unnamed protein product [Moneuplotes crassus]
MSSDPFTEAMIQSDDDQYRNPFDIDINPEGEIDEEIIESIGIKTNFESRNDKIETPDEGIIENINTDEINARKAFLYFNDCDIEKQGEESFYNKVKKIQNELSRLKLVVSKVDSEDQDDSKEETKQDSESKIDSSKVLKEIDAMQTRVNKLINPKLSKNSPSEDSKPLSELVSALSLSDGSDSHNVVYELMYNSDCKNLMVAAKISELKKRINVIQKCLSGWSDKDSSKYKDISFMLSFTGDQVKFMNRKEVQRINDASLYPRTGEGRMSDDLKFDTEVVSELVDVVGEDKDESDLVEKDIHKLESLKNVHEQSSEIFNKIQNLQMSQNHILNNLTEDQKALGFIKESFAENVQIMKDNLKNIKERIAKLKK